MDKFELPPPSIRQINIQADRTGSFARATIAALLVEVVTCVGVLLAVLGMGYAADVRLDRMICAGFRMKFLEPGVVQPRTCQTA